MANANPCNRRGPFCRVRNPANLIRAGLFLGALGCNAREARRPATSTPLTTTVGGPTSASRPPNVNFGPRDFGPATPATLARDGRPLLEIRLPTRFDLPKTPPNSSAPETQKRAHTLAASLIDLQRILKTMSGASFQLVRTDDLTEGIVLGTKDDFKGSTLPALEQTLELRENGDGREAFFIQTDARRVVLAGNTAYGLSHAIYAVLSELGYRHFMQGPAWEIIPRQRNISLAMSRGDRPAFLLRGISPLGSDANFGTASVGRDRSSWYRSLGLEGASLLLFPGHSWRGLEKRSFAGRSGADIFNEHPEYILGFGQSRARSGLPFSPDVLRTNGGSDYKLDISRPEVRAMMLEAYRRKLQTLESVPGEETSLPVGPTDGGGWYLEDLADPDWYRKLGNNAPGWSGSVSDHVFGFANFMADQLSRDFPDRRLLFSLMAYDAYHKPPGFPLHPKVRVSVVQGSCGSASCGLRELLEWKKRAGTAPLMAMEYLSVWVWTHGEPPASLQTTHEALKRHLYDELYSNGVRALTAESQSDMALNGLGYYLFARGLWNPLANFAALRADFMERAFGTAATAMDAYYRSMDPATSTPLSYVAAANSVSSLDAAGRAAARDSEATRRIDLVKLYWYYTYLKRRLDQSPDDPLLRRKFLELFYRQRQDYAISYDGFSAELIRRFGDWQKSTVPAPWRGSLEASGCPLGKDGKRITCSRPEFVGDAHPFSHQETESLWSEVTRYFAPVPLTTASYSEDLVPVNEARSAHPNSCFDPGLALGGRTPIDAWLYSFDGEPIELKLYDFSTTRPLLHYTATVLDRAGHTVWSSGWQTRPTTEPLLIRAQVPQLGAYRILIEHDSLNVRVKPSPGSAMAFNPTPSIGSRTRRSGSAQQTIYVPSSSSSFELDAALSKPELTLFPPNGASVAASPIAGQFSHGAVVRLSVPSNQSGFWRLQVPKAGTTEALRMFGAPNLLVNAEGYLLLPRELVLTDGLTIAKSPFPRQRLDVRGLGAKFDGRFSEVLDAPDVPRSQLPVRSSGWNPSWEMLKSEAALFRSDREPSVFLLRTASSAAPGRAGHSAELGLGWFVLFDAADSAAPRYVARPRSAADALIQDSIGKRSWQRVTGDWPGSEEAVNASMTSMCE